jgi:hypothetical protein
MDIVERLREFESVKDYWGDWEIAKEAADEIERLQKDYALAWENHLLHEQIFVLTEAKIERLQEALVEIVYQIGQGNYVAAMDIAAPIAESYIHKKGE